VTDPTDHSVPPGLADLPLDVRRARDVETFREQQEGIARRHDVIAESDRRYVAGLRAHALRIAPTIRAVLDGPAGRED
jgi:hypothetical protein